MVSNNQSYLSEDEVNRLPTLAYTEIGDTHIYRYGLVYDQLTRVCIGKITEFTLNDKMYFRELPNALPTILSNGDRDSDFTTLSWKELSELEYPPEEWRVNGLLPMQGLVIIAAPSGEKKTWFALELTKSISAGSHFLAHDSFQSHQSKVLYVDAEMGPRLLQKRCKQLGFDVIPDKYSPQFITGSEINLKESEAFSDFESLIEQNQFEVIVLDTLRAVAGGLEEDSATAVREFYQRFNALKFSGKLIIILDHNRKPDRGSHGMPRKEFVLGSQDKIANAEVVLMIKGDVNPAYFTVHQVKHRNGVEMKPFNVGIRDIVGMNSGFTTVEMNYEGELDEHTSKMDEAKIIIPQIVSNEFVLTSDVIKVLAKDHDIAERYCREALRQLVDSGILEQTKKGRSHAFKLIANRLLEEVEVPGKV